MINSATSTISDLATTIDGGTLTISGDKATLTKPGALNRSYLSKRLPARPGMVVRISVMAKINTAVGSGVGGVFIDYPSPGVVANQVVFNSKYWKRYEARYTIPITADIKSNIIQISIGMPTSSAVGEIDISKVEISVSGATVAISNALCLISHKKGEAPAFNENYAKIGVKSISYNENSLKYSLITAGGGAIGTYPIFIAQLSSDDLNAYSVRCGGYNPVTGEIGLFINDSSGNRVNVNTLQFTNLYIWVMSQGV